MLVPEIGVGPRIVESKRLYDAKVDALIQVRRGIVDLDGRDLWCELARPVGLRAFLRAEKVVNPRARLRDRCSFLLFPVRAAVGVGRFVDDDNRSRWCELYATVVGLSAFSYEKIRPRG